MLKELQSLALDVELLEDVPPAPPPAAVGKTA
jgi:hypothetical protein